jgi:integrase
VCPANARDSGTHADGPHRALVERKEVRYARDGGVFSRGGIWWIAYYVNGQEHRESARSDRESDARRLLKDRLKQIHGGRYVGPQEERLMVSDLLDALITHLETRGAKTVDRLKSHLKPLRQFFMLTRAVNVTTAEVERYIAERLKADKARATVNRETGALKQAFNLARKQARLTRVPCIPMLREDNARQGFFEHSDFEGVVARLPEPINDIARFAYLTGWRRGEILSLRWEAVDRAAHEVRLRTSKNGEGRVLPLEGELWDLVERRWSGRTIERGDGTTKMSEFVFHRSGVPVVDFRKPWNEAFKVTKLPRRIFHDLRRTAVRNMVRAGVPQSIAMSISGHKTVSMFMRYNISNRADKVDALKRTAAHLAAQPKKEQGEKVVEMLDSAEASTQIEPGQNTDNPTEKTRSSFQAG